MKALRFTFITLLALGALAVAAMGTGLWLLSSERGSAWLVDRALQRTNGLVAVAAVEGSLRHGLTLYGVRLRLPQDQVDVERVTVSWNASAAFDRIVALDTVAATRIAYRRLADGATAPRGVVALPFEVRIGTATFDRLSLTVGGNTFEVGASRFGGTFAGGRLELVQVTTETNGVALRGAGAVALGETLALEADVEWQRAGEPALAGALVAAGDWPTLAVYHVLTAPFTATAEGTVDLAATPSADLAVEWREAAWPGVPGVSPTGSATLAGTLEAVRFTVAAELVAEDRLVAVEARGDATRERVTLEALTAALAGDGAAGTIGAAGVIGIAARDFDLDLTLERVDPGWLAPGWPGHAIGMRYEDTLGPLGLLASVHPDKSIRDAAEACDLRYQEFSTSFLQNAKVYALLKQVQPADAIDRRFLRDQLDAFEDSGVGLPAEQQTRARANSTELTRLSPAVERRIREDRTLVAVTAAELTGVPPAVWKRSKRDAKGRYLLGLD
jgi:hypothetical protein